MTVNAASDVSRLPFSLPISAYYGLLTLRSLQIERGAIKQASRAQLLLSIRFEDLFCENEIKVRIFP
jgi:hypothetical protein